jgi:UMF1 family MFS transporter
MKLPINFSDNRSVYSWAMYDWANSAFATTIMAAVLPVFYAKVAAGNLEPNIASSYWGYTNTIAMLVVALLAPVLGAIADFRRSKIRFLTYFMLLGSLFSAMLFLVQSGGWLMASVFYVIGRIGFSGSNIFYDSLLPHLARKDDIDRISTFGYSLGYLGGGILLAINFVMILSPEVFGIPDTATGTRLSFVTVGIWWLVFSFPLLKNIPEPGIGKTSVSRVNAISAGFRNLLNTFRHLRTFRHAFLFLLAFWFYNDGIGTIIVMAVIFGAEIGIGQEHLFGAILAVQFIGVPFTVLFGKLAAKITAKRAVYLGLIIYTLISIGGYFMQNALHFWLLAIVVGMVQGGTQALSRSLFALMTPQSKSAEFFGFFDVSQKFSGIIGPALFGLVGQWTGSSRLSIIALIVFFIGGMFMLEKVRLPEGIEAAREADAQANLNQ